MNRFKWLVLALGMTALASVGLVACGDDEQVACESASDCDDGQLCVGGTCADPCTDADDCTGNQACSVGCQDTPQPICFQQCSSNDDCNPGSVCNTEFCGGAFGRCVTASAGQCSSNSDCDNGEVCNVFTGMCEAPCTQNSDCGEDGGLVCNTTTGQCISAGGGCSGNNDCGEGQVCTAGACVDENPDACTDTADCYNEGDAYCGSVGGENVCVNTACGVAFNACSRCTLGANGGSKQNNAPVIFSAEQVSVGGASRCEANSSQCGGEGAKLFCKFSFHFFDPNDDFQPSNSNVFVVSGKGGHNTTFAVRSIGSGIAEFGACFPDGVNTPGTAVFVRDAARNASNTLCTTGSR